MSGYRFRRLYLPYCLKRLPDGRYIVLNCRYKPLGLQTDEWVDYESHPTAARMKMTPAIAMTISWNGSDDTDTIYLFRGDENPFGDPESTAAFAKRLATLGEVMVTKPGRHSQDDQSPR